MKYALLICCLAFMAQFGSAQQKIDPALMEQYAEAPIQEAIVLFKEKAQLQAARHLSNKAEKGTFVYHSLKQVATKSQARVIDFLEQSGIDYRSYAIINGIYLKATKEQLDALTQFGEVNYIQPNPTTSFPEPEVDRETSGSRTTEWGLDMIGAPTVWAMGFTGQGAVVGGQDTGYDWNHPAIEQKYRGYNGGNIDHNYNWHDAIHEISPLHGDSIPDPSLNPCGLDIVAPCDDHRHGTHTMGTMIGGEGENEIGVAPGATWIGVRNMERGYGSPATYLEGFEWFLAPTDLNNENPDPTKAPDVINNSWSCPTMEGCELSNFGILEEAVNNLKTAGVVVVVSAGNSGPACSTVNTPSAIFENSFSVGSTRSNDTISNFSSRGPVLIDNSGRTKPNISAPGQGVRSSVLNGEYQSLSGTSMAGPHVAGLVALMISANPQLAGQVEVIESIIERTAVPKTSDQDCGNIPGSEVPNNTYGYGRIDAVAAVNQALLTTSIQPVEAIADFKVFPNPASDRVMILVEKNWQDALINIYAQDGKLVYTKDHLDSGNLSINLETFSAGVYFVELTGTIGKQRSKFVKY